MRAIVIRWLIMTVAILLTAYLLAGIRVSGFFSALAAAAILGILNTFLKPILIILTLPITVITLGLFTFVINALLLLMVSGVISGFQVAGFGWALLGAFLISVVSWILSTFISDQEDQFYVEVRRGDRPWRR